MRPYNLFLKRPHPTRREPTVPAKSRQIFQALAQLIPLACNHDVPPTDHTSRISLSFANGSIYPLMVDAGAQLVTGPRDSATHGLKAEKTGDCVGRD